MKRLTIIGTSHVAAVKQGWDLVAAEYPDWQVDFFAATTTHFHNLRLQDSKRFGLSKTTAEQDPTARRAVKQINGRTRIDLAKADFVLWTGFGRPLSRLCDLLAQFDVDGLRETGAERRISRAALDAICAEIAAGTGAVPKERWRGWTSPRLLVNFRPAPSETVLERDDPRTEAWRVIAADPRGFRAAADALTRAHAAELARHGIGLLRQPEETLTPGGLTANRWSIGAPVLGGKSDHAATDVEHMNASYGACLLRALFAQLADDDRAQGPDVAQPVATAASTPATHPCKETA